MPTFYPSVVVNMKIRFDESLQVQPAETPVPNRAGLNSLAKPAQPQPQPLITQRGDANTTFILGRVPIKASVELPGYREAGKFSAEFEFRDVPIDPRTVRAAAVEIHCGAVPASEFSAGMGAVTPDAPRRSVITTRTAAGQPNPETLQLVGIVDEWNVTHNDSGSTISISGRDLRAPLIDTPISTKPGEPQVLADLDFGQPIDRFVTQLLRVRPEFADYTVAVNPEEWPGGIVPSPNADGVVPRVRRGANGARAGGRGTPNSGSADLSFWDMITRTCYLVGAIPYFRGFELLIRPSRNIFTQQNAGNDPMNPTPFSGGEPRYFDAPSRTILPDPLRVRRLVYGRDVESISFDRKFGGYQRPRVVRCVSTDTSSPNRGTARIVEGRWPTPAAPERARRTRVAPGDGGATEEILNIPVPGVRDPARLQFIAQSIFEEIGRGELGGACSTRNLASFGGDNRDPDLIRLKPGDAIEFGVDTRYLNSTPPLVSAYTDNQRASFEEAVADITSRIGDENLARVLVATSRGQIKDLQRFFRVSTVKFSWDGSGMKIDFDFQNYFVPALENLTKASTGVVERTSVPGQARRRRRTASRPLEIIEEGDAVFNVDQLPQGTEVGTAPDGSLLVITTESSAVNFSTPGSNGDLSALPIFGPRRAT